jgi:hypothetical protein
MECHIEDNEKLSLDNKNLFQQLQKTFLSHDTSPSFLNNVALKKLHLLPVFFNIIVRRKGDYHLEYPVCSIP